MSDARVFPCPSKHLPTIASVCCCLRFLHCHLSHWRFLFLPFSSLTDREKESGQDPYTVSLPPAFPFCCVDAYKKRPWLSLFPFSISLLQAAAKTYRLPAAWFFSYMLIKLCSSFLSEITLGLQKQKAPFQLKCLDKTSYSRPSRGACSGRTRTPRQEVHLVFILIQGVAGGQSHNLIG